MLLEICIKGRGTGIAVHDQDLDLVVRVLRKHPQSVVKNREVLLPKLKRNTWVDAQVFIGDCTQVLRPLGKQFVSLEQVPF